VKAACPTRQEIEAAFGHHRACQDRGDWNALADGFAPDAGYFDAIHGWQHGRDGIRTFFQRTMTGSGKWHFPERWRVIDGHRLVFHWSQIFDETRPDGSPYRFDGITSLVYAGEGVWSEQMDVYDTARARAVLGQWARDRKGS
jgi:ketosteroid isomerase-like protein